MQRREGEWAKWKRGCAVGKRGGSRKTGALAWLSGDARRWLGAAGGARGEGDGLWRFLRLCHACDDPRRGVKATGGSPDEVGRQQREDQAGMRGRCRVVADNWRSCSALSGGLTEEARCSIDSGVHRCSVVDFSRNFELNSRFCKHKTCRGMKGLHFLFLKFAQKLKEFGDKRF